MQHKTLEEREDLNSEPLSVILPVDDVAELQEHFGIYVSEEDP